MKKFFEIAPYVGAKNGKSFAFCLLLVMIIALMRMQVVRSSQSSACVTELPFKRTKNHTSEPARRKPQKHAKRATNRRLRHRSHFRGHVYRDIYNYGTVNNYAHGNFKVKYSDTYEPRPTRLPKMVPATNTLGDFLSPNDWQALRVRLSMKDHKREQPQVEPAELHQPQGEPVVKQPAQKKMSTGQKVCIGVGAALGVGLGWLVWKKTR